MKYKQQKTWLEQKLNWYDKLPEREKASRKRPGSIKTR